MKRLFTFQYKYMQYAYLFLFVFLYGVGIRFNGQAETLLVALAVVSGIRVLQLIFDGETADWFTETCIAMMVAVVLIAVGYVIAYVAASIFKVDLATMNSVYSAVVLFFVITGSLELKFKE